MFPRTNTTSPPTNAPAERIRNPIDDRATGTVRSSGAPARMSSEAMYTTSATTMTVACRVALVRATPSVSE